MTPSGGGVLALDDIFSISTFTTPRVLQSARRH
jgi:hypothetical protein